MLEHEAGGRGSSGRRLSQASRAPLTGARSQPELALERASARSKPAGHEHPTVSRGDLALCSLLLAALTTAHGQAEPEQPNGAVPDDVGGAVRRGLSSSCRRHGRSSFPDLGTDAGAKQCARRNRRPNPSGLHT